MKKVSKKSKREIDPTLTPVSLQGFLGDKIVPFLKYFSKEHRLEGPISYSAFFSNTLLKPTTFDFEIRNRFYITYDGGLKAKHVRPLLKAFLDEHVLKFNEPEEAFCKHIPALLASMESAKTTSPKTQQGES